MGQNTETHLVKGSPVYLQPLIPPTGYGKRVPRCSVVHTISNKNDLNSTARLVIHWIYPPTQDASHHQDYSIFRIGNPELNLHLWLASWVGCSRPKLSSIFSHTRKNGSKNGMFIIQKSTPTDFGLPTPTILGEILGEIPLQTPPNNLLEEMLAFIPFVLKLKTKVKLYNTENT